MREGCGSRSKAADLASGERENTVVCHGLPEEKLLACEPLVINATWDGKCCIYENVLLPV